MFQDRTQAGAVLGRLVADQMSERPDILLALPRGGVPVGYEVARAFPGASFDIFLVRKLGVPGREELAFGAIASGGVRFLNHGIIQQLHLSPETIERVSRQEEAELERRDQTYREGRPPLNLAGMSVVLVDDGLATGATMMAAVQAARAQQARWVVVAVPVASPESRKQLLDTADDVVCASVPHPFYAVGENYREFEQIDDEEVRDYLKRFALSSRPRTAPQTYD